MRSFSKGHAMGGFRVGYAVLGSGVSLPLAPVGGVGAAAVAGALWAVENGASGVARRREQVARERARLVDALGARVADGRGAVRVAGGLGRGARRRAGVRGARDRVGV